MAFIFSSSLGSSHFHLHFLSSTLHPPLKPYLSYHRSTPPNSGNSPSPDSKENDSLPSLTGDLKTKNRKKNRKKNVIRRDPVDIGVRRTQEDAKKEKKEETMSDNEGAFVVAWLGLGALILVEGLTLAASGFLPEEWDKLFVKYLYPLFTPTVFLFVGGSVVYGVIKYLEAEKMNKS